MPKAPKALVTKLDLTLVSNQLLVLSWIRNPQVKAVFLAPPCGTASAGRNIQKGDGPTLPKPLRSAEFPDGLPVLQGMDFLRVEHSNILYDFSAIVFDLCCEWDKLCMCENPRDPLYIGKQLLGWIANFNAEIVCNVIKLALTAPSGQSGPH